MISPQDDCVYTLSEHNPRGFAVIVNITKNRDGSRIDVRKMRGLFEWMNYTIVEIEDQTKEVRHRELHVTVNLCYLGDNSTQNSKIDNFC